MDTRLTSVTHLLEVKAFLSIGFGLALVNASAGLTAPEIKQKHD